MSEFVRSYEEYLGFLDSLQPFCISLHDGRQQHMLGCFTIFSDGLEPFLRQELPTKPKEFWDYVLECLGEEPNERMLKFYIRKAQQPNTKPAKMIPVAEYNLSEDDVVYLFLQDTYTLLKNKVSDGMREAVIASAKGFYQRGEIPEYLLEYRKEE